MNKLYCNDGCQEEFSLPQLKIESTEHMPGGFERHYIECPNCGQQYNSYFLDDEMKKIQHEISVLRKKGITKLKQKNKFTKLKRKLLFMNEQLKKKYEQYEMEKDEE